ncbi:hypothetical protein ACFSKY_14980 [Azotobacter chroococcum]|uniref:Uncharacterized protein n=1 Tax=Azotobacter chroococcum TaxID=353 RepID=A0A4R1P967_9GAMM|nr:hypothetical protein [Azotobacter chroococcum]TBV97199.1 hypothetical protein E0E53_09220 [Azotobacter chroococcum]TCL22627.1 hypothetical protein EV691_1303 [Azotobacter chroococcum]
MIRLLGSDAFAGQLSPPRNHGASPIFRAKIRVDGASLHCYVKPLPDHIRCPVTGKEVANQEIVSEALGYVLAKSVGLNVPDTAGIILLEPWQIPEALHPALRETCSGRAQNDYFCWFTKDMKYPSLRQLHWSDVRHPYLQELRGRRLARQLADNPEASSIIVLDQWLLNSDRNIGNLLESPCKSLFLIDHGRLFHYPNWEPGRIGMAPWPCENRLQKLIDDFIPDWSEALPNKSARALAYNIFAVSFREAGAEAARIVLSEFFEHTEIEVILRLLSERLDQKQYTEAADLLL